MRRSAIILLLVASAFARRHPKPDTRLFVPCVEAAEAQTRVSQETGLTRIKNDRELQEMVKSGALVPLEGVRVDPRLPTNRRYVRPWTRDVISALSAEFSARFSTPLTVTSAVRPESVQRRLRRWNRNAAPATVSSHPTGTTVDVTRRGMTQEQVRFVEDALLNLAMLNRVIVLEEKRQPCFHIFVIPRVR